MQHTNTISSGTLLWTAQTTLSSVELRRISEQLNRGSNLQTNELQSVINSCLNEERGRIFESALEHHQSRSSPLKVLTRYDVARLTGRSLPEHFPLALRYSGNPELLRKKRVAVIGSRHPTFYGREQAAIFSRALAEADVTVVSGAAIGIDTVANLMAHACGSTIAVLGSGLAVPYPRSNSTLFNALASSGRGLILSEFEDFRPAEKWHFPIRNRVIAAICDFLLVVEAGVRSGTMITASLAADYGVDVGALPGPVHSATSQGSNLLIKEGAFCIERPEEILERFINLGHQKCGLRETWANDSADTEPLHETLF